MQYLALLNIVCGYQCDKAVTKNDTCEAIWSHSLQLNDIISLQGPNCPIKYK